LLDDWASSQVDVEWLNELSEVLVSHPPGSSMQGTADWSRVAAALRRLRVACGISGPPSTLKEEDQRHCRALTDIFCARACRYRDAVSAQERAEFDAEADNLYRQAATLLSTDGDQWGLAWVHLELAEFWHQGRQEQKGLENWNLAAALNIKWQFQDEELIASLQRVSGDLYCARQEWSAAFAAYGRAVLHAYLFQNRPHPPDWYTLQFYRDTTEWTLERLAEFAEQGLMTQAVEYALAVRRALPAIAVARVVPTPQAIEGLLTTRKFDALRMFLFPTAPTVDELGDARSSFIDIWEEAVEDLGAEVADDL
ncbi:MAG: hypothetical protein JWM18_1884, partial [Chloroflexi bacterium]|nr:hypothetical protein [Chloroflexota bacterium]